MQHWEGRQRWQDSMCGILLKTYQTVRGHARAAPTATRCTRRRTSLCIASIVGRESRLCRRHRIRRVIAPGWEWQSLEACLVRPRRIQEPIIGCKGPRSLPSLIQRCGRCGTQRSETFQSAKDSHGGPIVWKDECAYRLWTSLIAAATCWQYDRLCPIQLGLGLYMNTM